MFLLNYAPYYFLQVTKLINQQIIIKQICRILFILKFMIWYSHYWSLGYQLPHSIKIGAGTLVLYAHHGYHGETHCPSFHGSFRAMCPPAQLPLCLPPSPPIANKCHLVRLESHWLSVSCAVALAATFSHRCWYLSSMACEWDRVSNTDSTQIPVTFQVLEKTALSQWSQASSSSLVASIFCEPESPNPKSE